MLTAVAVAVAPLPVSTPAHAQAQSTIPRGIPLIRDAEIEQLLRDYTHADPAGRGASRSSNVQVVIIQDRSFNAFVMDGRHIFVNAGALMDAKTPNEIIGVMAHETGHMAGGHLSKMRQQMATLQTASIMRHAARHGRGGCGRRQLRQSGRGRPRPAGNHPPLAPLLRCAPRRSRPTAPA